MHNCKSSAKHSADEPERSTRSPAHRLAKPRPLHRSIRRACRLHVHINLARLVWPDGNMDAVKFPARNSQRIMPDLKTILRNFVRRLAVPADQLCDTLALLHLLNTTLPALKIRAHSGLTQKAEPPPTRGGTRDTQTGIAILRCRLRFVRLRAHQRSLYLACDTQTRRQPARRL